MGFATRQVRGRLSYIEKLIRLPRSCLQPESLKSALRPSYHCAFRFLLRSGCFLSDIVCRGRNRALNIPSALLRYRVSESIDADKFLKFGEGCARLVEEQLRQMGKEFVPGMRILDFGCGCGRVAAYVMKSAPQSEFCGVDVDAEAVQWCSDHLKGGDFRRTLPNPPLPYPSGYFDVIYCVSVFTHLDEKMQDAWLEELKRVLSPGGILIFTVHGRVAAELLASDEREKLGHEGFIYHRSNKLRGIVPDSYHTAWHEERYVVKHALQWFSEVQYCVIPDSSQDIVRCRV